MGDQGSGESIGYLEAPLAGSLDANSRRSLQAILDDILGENVCITRAVSLAYNGLVSTLAGPLRAYWFSGRGGLVVS